MRGDSWTDRWAEFELRRVNKGLVTKKKTLGMLLSEARPQCLTNDGESYEFDAETLKRLASGLHAQEDLMVPITLYFVSDSRDSCYISDETASEVLRRLEGFGEAYPFRDGKMWLPNSLAFSLIHKYPTVIQGMFF